jgi:hypothetical protein
MRNWGIISYDQLAVMINNTRSANTGHSRHGYSVAGRGRRRYAESRNHRTEVVGLQSYGRVVATFGLIPPNERLHWPHYCLRVSDVQKCDRQTPDEGRVQKDGLQSPVEAPFSSFSTSFTNSLIHLSTVHASSKPSSPLCGGPSSCGSGRSSTPHSHCMSLARCSLLLCSALTAPP